MKMIFLVGAMNETIQQTIIDILLLECFCAFKLDSKQEYLDATRLGKNVILISCEKYLNHLDIQPSENTSLILIKKESDQQNNSNSPFQNAYYLNPPFEMSDLMKAISQHNLDINRPSII